MGEGTRGDARVKEWGVMMCQKCGYEWRPKVAGFPKRCPNCKSSSYMFPRGIGIVGGVDESRRRKRKRGSDGDGAAAEAKAKAETKAEAEAKARAKVSGGSRDKSGGGEAKGKGKGGESAALTSATTTTTTKSADAGVHPAGTEMCTHRELDKETNEWVYCALPRHKPGIKCVPGRRETAG